VEGDLEGVDALGQLYQDLGVTERPDWLFPRVEPGGLMLSFPSSWSVLVSGFRANLLAL
jgi:hypothetical protein